jgi:signal transduction histidine kinase
MSAMAPAGPPAATRWYQTLYLRISLGFLILIVGVLGLQSVIFTYVVAQSRAALPGRSPNNFAAIVAADIAAALAKDPQLDLSRYLSQHYGAILNGVFVVMKDGRVASSAAEMLPDPWLRAAETALGGIDGRPADEIARVVGPPVVMAPIQIASHLRGMVIVPPRTAVGGIMWDIGRTLSLPGAIILLLATLVGVLFIVGPARRRLHALEIATTQLGSGDLTARAPEGGGDEIARVAHAFNKMAEDLAARDEALRTSDRQRRQMLADVSHELRTPLTTMRGYLETLHMPEVILDTGTRDRYLQTVEAETLRLERIVKDLLDLARYESGGGELETRPFAIERLFAGIRQRHLREADARHITVDIAIDGVDQIVGDPGRLEQVIDNLVVNALRHTATNGHLRLEAHAIARRVQLAVSNTGPGIPPEHLPRVFERFYKADSARSNTAGSGLGLSIAKAIVERHGGTITVVSMADRTTFTVSLPHHPDDLPAA